MLQEARVYADENGLFFMETSAKTAANVNDIFYEIGAIVIWLLPYGYYILASFLLIWFFLFIIMIYFNLMSMLTWWELSLLLHNESLISVKVLEKAVNVFFFFFNIVVVFLIKKKIDYKCVTSIFCFVFSFFFLFIYPYENEL